MKLKTVQLSILFFLLTLVSVYSQNDKSFDTKEEYLGYLNKKCGIGKEEMYYIPKQYDDSINIPIERYSIFMFVKNKQIVTFEEASKEARCSTDRILNGLDLNKLEMYFQKSPEYSNFVFKNMFTDEIIIPQKDEIVAIFMFSYKFKHINYMRIKDRKEIASKLGIRTFVVSLDGYDLKSIDDISKTHFRVE